MNIDFQQHFNDFIQLAMMYVPRLMLAVITLLIGLWLTKLAIKIMDKTFKMKKVDPSLSSFLESFLGLALKILVFVTVASMVGVEMTSFVALLGAAGLAVGLALQGSLSNFAGGILILMFKPFKVGDFIEAQDHEGYVTKITIINTSLKTRDNKVVTIPNGLLSNEAIKNYSTEKILRVDLEFGIGYGDDIKKAKEVLLEVISKNPHILKDPAPMIAVGNLGASSVDLVCRVWCKTEYYWQVHFDTLEQVKTAYDSHQISIPYPQREVHLRNVD